MDRLSWADTLCEEDFSRKGAKTQRRKALPLPLPYLAPQLFEQLVILEQRCRVCLITRKWLRRIADRLERHERVILDAL
jgi:hypothetical protein